MSSFSFIPCCPTQNTENLETTDSDKDWNEFSGQVANIYILSNDFKLIVLLIFFSLSLVSLNKVP